MCCLKVEVSKAWNLVHDMSCVVVWRWKCRRRGIWYMIWDVVLFEGGGVEGVESGTWYETWCCLKVEVSKAWNLVHDMRCGVVWRLRCRRHGIWYMTWDLLLFEGGGVEGVESGTSSAAGNPSTSVDDILPQRFRLVTYSVPYDILR